MRAARWVLDCGPIAEVTGLKAAETWDSSMQELREITVRDLVEDVGEDRKILLRLRLASSPGDVEELLKFTALSPNDAGQLARASQEHEQDEAATAGWQDNASNAAAGACAMSVFTWKTEELSVFGIAWSCLHWTSLDIQCPPTFCLVPFGALPGCAIEHSRANLQLLRVDQSGRQKKARHGRGLKLGTEHSWCSQVHVLRGA